VLDQRRAIADVPDRSGFAFAMGETTDAGLRLLQATLDTVGLVTDAHVPENLNCWELAQRPCAFKPNLTVVLRLGHSDPTSSPPPEGAAFMVKPNVLASLVAILREITGDA